MKKELLENYKKTLSKSSKWYNQDIEDFKQNLDKCSKTKLKEMYNNMIAFNSEEFENKIKEEENKLMKAGMYNITKMQPVNMLD
jgi:hypothetical protein